MLHWTPRSHKRAEHARTNISSVRMTSQKTSVFPTLFWRAREVISYRNYDSPFYPNSINCPSPFLPSLPISPHHHPPTPSQPRKPSYPQTLETPSPPISPANPQTRKPSQSPSYHIPFPHHQTILPPPLPSVALGAQNHSLPSACFGLRADAGIVLLKESVVGIASGAAGGGDVLYCIVRGFLWVRVRTGRLGLWARVRET